MPVATTRRVTYQNPVFARDFPDPFVLKFRGEYWAYCTGFQPDGRVFGILRSRDLAQWQEMGGAMAPLPGDHSCYWAPEVSYDNGRFYLYYSVGDEATMHLRVATATDPAGPFTDAGVRLTREPFAIDAHVFTARDGRRYLFYATDFLEHHRVGTGTVMDRLLDPFTLAGQPRPVTRAGHDWQIYDPRRAEKGDVRWHTLEGPFVLERKGVYYQMFSGGNWQNPTYGVGYATTANLDAPEEWEQVCNGEQVLPVLRTIPGQVIGPGHNSAVRGPDNRQLYCVYHRWGDDGRYLAIDPLDFAGDRLFVLGPSDAPRPGPNPPTLADSFDTVARDSYPARRQSTHGAWQIGGGQAVATPEAGETAVLIYEVGELPFLAEVSARALAGEVGSYGVSLNRGLDRVLKQMQPSSESGSHRSGSHLSGFHLLRVEVDGRRATLSVDDSAAHWEGELSEPPTHIALFASGAPAAFAGFALTVGWQDCFEADATPSELGWESDRPAGWAIDARQLIFANPGGEGVLHKGPPLAAYELVINARLAAGGAGGGCYGIMPALAGGAGPLFTVEQSGAGWAAHWRDGATTERFPLPATFDPTVYQQFRFRKSDGLLTIHWEQHEIAAVPVTAEATRVGLYGRRATAAFDMVRVTAILEDTSP